MDPQTKRAITAHDAEELRDLLRKWLDARGVSQTYNQSFTPASVMIEITYADSDGALSRMQWIHTTPSVLREWTQTKLTQGAFFK